MAVTPTTTSTTSEPAHEGSGGLPQFDPAWWPGQAVWFLIIFAVLFALMAKVFVPRVGGAIAEREDRIAGDIGQARRLKEQAEVQAAAAEQDLAAGRARAQKLASDARARVKAEADARQAAEEAKLADTLAAAEVAIRASRDAAMAQVRDIAADAAGSIVAKLTGKSASKAEVQAALAGHPAGRA
jgi:F-type H+-transporting ATPase subunit b